MFKAEITEMCNLSPTGDVDAWAARAEFREFCDGSGSAVSTNLEGEIEADVEGRCLYVKSGEDASVGGVYAVTGKRTTKVWGVLVLEIPFPSRV